MGTAYNPLAKKGPAPAAQKTPSLSSGLLGNAQADTSQAAVPLGAAASSGFGANVNAAMNPLPEAPTIDTAQLAIQQAQDEQLRRSTAGRGSTILSGGAGVTSAAKTTRAALLGMA